MYTSPLKDSVNNIYLWPFFYDVESYTSSCPFDGSDILSGIFESQISRKEHVYPIRSKVQ